MQAKTANAAQAHSVAIVAFDGMSMLEFAVAAAIFGSAAPDGWDRPWYRLSLCAAQRQIVIDGGLRLDVPLGLHRLRQADTVVVPPTDDPDAVPRDVVRAIAQAHRRGARVVSLCTGAFVLAAAGLLSGRRATTHWQECHAFALRYPDVQVDADLLYVDEGDVLTSAGCAASMDLCLHLVRQDFGAEAATWLARDLVVAPHRDGGQAQFIAAPMPSVNTEPVAQILSWLQEHLDEQITIDDLANRCAMSRRTFARHFLAATGTTPYQWLVRQRLQLAQRLLETTTLSIDAVSERSGFGDAGNLRKQFTRQLLTTPQAYRKAFAG